MTVVMSAAPQTSERRPGRALALPRVVAVAAHRREDAVGADVVAGRPAERAHDAVVVVLHGLGAGDEGLPRRIDTGSLQHLTHHQAVPVGVEPLEVVGATAAPTAGLHARRVLGER